MYFLRRALLLIPTVIAIVICVFLLAEVLPGDIIADKLQSAVSEEGMLRNPQAREAAYGILAQKMRLDLPPFYVSIRSLSESDTLQHIVLPERRARIMDYLSQSGNMQQALRMDSMYTAHQPPENQAILQRQESKNQWRNYIPVIKWQGWHNRFHQYFIGLLHGDFGYSYTQKRGVAPILAEALPVTLALNLLAIIFGILIGILCGLILSRDGGAPLLRIIIDAAFALPSFGVATLLLLFFTGGTYLNWFPISGFSELQSEDASAMEMLGDHLYHLILPVFVLAYPIAAMIARQLEQSIRMQLDSDYIVTARAKGLAKYPILIGHALPNALLPLIANFSALVAGLFSGSVIIENIFSIPGIGSKAFAAARFQDYPLVTGALLLAALMTVLAHFLGDILYTRVDPRIRFSSPNRTGS